MNFWDSIKRLFGVCKTYTHEELTSFDANINKYAALPYSEEDHIKQLEWRLNNWLLHDVDRGVINNKIYCLMKDIQLKRIQAREAAARSIAKSPSSWTPPTTRPSGNLPTKHEMKTDRGFAETVTVYDTSPSYSVSSSSSSSRSCSSSYDSGSSYSSSSDSSSSSSGCD